MTPYEIPFSAQAETFQIVMLGVMYNITSHWSAPAGCWLLDIASGAGVPIITSIPVITGTDLLEQHSYLGFGGGLRVQSDSAPDEVPTFVSLGVSGHVYFIAP